LLSAEKVAIPEESELALLLQMHVLPPNGGQEATDCRAVAQSLLIFDGVGIAV